MRGPTPRRSQRVAQLGEVISETTDAADITEQYVDAEARLASAQQLEKRLLELATARSCTIGGVADFLRKRVRVDAFWRRSFEADMTIKPVRLKTR